MAEYMAAENRKIKIYFAGAIQIDYKSEFIVIAPVLFSADYQHIIKKLSEESFNNGYFRDFRYQNRLGDVYKSF